MKIRIFYILGVLSLTIAFWACGDGDVYLPEADDLVAVEKFEKLSTDELDAMMDSCLANSSCRAKWDSSLGRPEWKKPGKSSSSHSDSSRVKKKSLIVHVRSSDR